MIEQKITISNRAGIHARPAALLVQAVKDFKSSVYFEKDKDRINAKSVMGILTLGVTYGTELKILAEGEDEEEAVAAVVRLFESKFQEE
jgi:phosphocarrier protein